MTTSRLYLSEHQFCCMYGCDNVATHVLQGDQQAWPVCINCKEAIEFGRSFHGLSFSTMESYDTERNPYAVDAIKELSFLYKEVT